MRTSAGESSISAGEPSPAVATFDVDRPEAPGVGAVLTLLTAADIRRPELDEAVQEALDRFYRDVMYALDVHMQRKSATAQGSAAVVKHVAQAHGLEVADRLPLPRLCRAELEDRRPW
ncbi:MAG: hypothetical protein QOH79_2407 [Acidimicrobiaceae bacterium]